MRVLGYDDSIILQPRFLIEPILVREGIRRSPTPSPHYLPPRRLRCLVGGAENASTGKSKYGKGKYETAHFARMEDGKRKYGKRKYESAGMENASRPTENASTMQTFSQIKKVWYFTSFSVGAFSSGVGKWITDCFFLR